MVGLLLFVLNKGLLISQEARKIQPTRTQCFNCFLKGGWREKYFYFFQQKQIELRSQLGESAI